MTNQTSPQTDDVCVSQRSTHKHYTTIWRSGRQIIWLVSSPSSSDSSFHWDNSTGSFWWEASLFEPISSIWQQCDNRWKEGCAASQLDVKAVPVTHGKRGREISCFSSGFLDRCPESYFRLDLVQYGEYLSLIRMEHRSSLLFSYQSASDYQVCFSPWGYYQSEDVLTFWGQIGDKQIRMRLHFMVKNFYDSKEWFETIEISPRRFYELYFRTTCCVI
jgi:hypothetical protein